MPDSTPATETQAQSPYRQVVQGGTIPANTELMKALWQAATAQAATAQAATAQAADQSAFFSLLRDAKVVAVLGAPPEIGPNGELLHVNYRATLLNGETLMLACTDVDTLNRYTHEEPIPWMVVPFLTVCHDILRAGFHGVLLNPAGPVTVRITRLQVESLVAGFLPAGGQASQGTQEATISFEKPKKPLPKRIRSAIRQVGHRSKAGEIWWCWVKLGDTPAKVGIIVSPPTEESLHAVRDAIGGVPEMLVKEGVSRDGAIHILPLEGEVGATAREVGEMLFRAGR